MKQTGTYQILANMDKPIFVFTGNLVSNAVDRFVLSRLFRNMEPKTAGLIRASLTTISSLLLYHQTKKVNPNLSYVFVGSASDGIAKTFKIITGGQLQGVVNDFIQGLLGTAEEDELAQDYPYEIEQIYPIAGDDFVSIPELSLPEPDLAQEQVSSAFDNEPVEDVHYEEIYEID